MKYIFIVYVSWTMFMLLYLAFYNALKSLEYLETFSNTNLTTN